MNFKCVIWFCADLCNDSCVMIISSVSCRFLMSAAFSCVFGCVSPLLAVTLHIFIDPFSVVCVGGRVAEEANQWFFHLHVNLVLCGSGYVDGVRHTQTNRSNWVQGIWFLTDLYVGIGVFLKHNIWLPVCMVVSVGECLQWQKVHVSNNATIRVIVYS